MFENRSYCGEINLTHDGHDVMVTGWVDKNRDLGGIVFLEIRDVSGIVQAVFDSSLSAENAAMAESARSEYVVQIEGTVRKRSEDTVNPNIPTGMIEILAKSITILNSSLVPPIPIDSRDFVAEEARLRYRYLDLRRDDMKESMIMRHRVMQTARKYLCDKRFIEVETPILNKSTPEGARDFLVPSRINRGHFYALPQSPQLFKQILMVSGFDRYFQIVKCFRDEDLRNDRQPEFTQIDMEFSFVDANMVMNVIEGLVAVMVKEVRGIDVELPFKRITYAEAMSRYGNDAPDMRFGLEITDCSDIFKNSSFNVFSSALSSGGVVKGIAVPDNGSISRKTADDYTSYVMKFGAKGFPMFKCAGGKAEGGIAKFVSQEEVDAIVKRFNITSPTVLFFSVDTDDIVTATLSHMRVKIAADQGLIDEDALAFVWVTDFPLLEYHAEDKRFYAKHHPFTSPTRESIPLLDSLTQENVDSVLAQAYDIVLNGSEIGGGSIRINRMELQHKMFGLLGMTEEEAAEKFSFLLEAFQYGAPPHGGIALGLDRVMMLLLKRASIREVIAFPKTQKGQCMMSKAPSPVDPQQLKELSLKVV